MNNDQEPAIVRTPEHVRDHKGSDVVQLGIEHSPANDHQANGMVVRAEQSIQG